MWAHRRPGAGLVVVLALVVTAACSGSAEGPLTIYTSVTQATVDEVVAGFEASHPDVSVEVFRAPTGEIAARIEAERRSDGIGADVLWLTDPLSMYRYDADGLLAAWSPENAATVEAPGGPSFWPTRLLLLTIVVAADNPQGLADWGDLVDPALRVAIPDPRFAGSAFAALGYFGLAPEYGLDFFRRLEETGTTQVSAPGDVVTGVAEGRFDAGLTLEFSTRDAEEKGSPVATVWPASGAIAVVSPVAVVAEAAADAAAREFVEYLLSPEGQAAVGETGWTPVLPDVPGPRPPDGVVVVDPDWPTISARQDQLVAEYASIFGG